jgi:hypothetical protein
MPNKTTDEIVDEIPILEKRDKIKIANESSQMHWIN